MEPYELGPVDDSVESKNVEPSMEGMVLPIQTEEDQVEGEFFGYIEVSNSGCEDATIYLDSQAGLSLNGRHLILMRNDTNQLMLQMVSEDTNGQHLAEAFAHAAANPNEGTIEEVVVKEQVPVQVSEPLEFIETEVVSQESEERHIYIESSDEIINSARENHCSTHLSIVSPVWPVANEVNLKSPSTKMLFIPNPTIFSPEEKLRNLLQLANAAESQSAGEKNSSPEIGESAKDADSSLNEFENSVRVIQNEVEKIPNALMLSVSSDINNSASTRTVDNAISVIHTTSSDFQGSSLENQATYASSSEFSIKHFNSSVNESEMVDSPVISGDSLHEESPSVCKELKDAEENRMTISSPSREQFSCSVVDPLTFVDKSKELNVDIEDDSVGMTDRRTDEGYCVENESKEVADDNNVSKKDSVEENGVIKDTFNQRTYSKKIKVPIESDSDCSVSKHEADKHKESVSKSNLPFRTTQYGIYKRKAKKLSFTESSILPQEVRVDNKSQDAISEYDFSEADGKEPRDNENGQVEMDSHGSPIENLDSHLVIAEDAECNTNVDNSHFCGHQSPQDFIFKGVTESTPDVEEAKFYHTKNEVLVTSNLAQNFDQDDVPASVPSLSSQEGDCREMKEDDSTTLISGSDMPKDSGDASFYNNEEPLVKPSKKTYIKKKTDKNVVESKINIKDKIELFSGDDFNFTECDKDIEEIQNSLNVDSQKESSAESDDLSLLSNVQVSATYNRKRKVMSPLKQRVQSRSLRPRSSSSKLPLENGPQELSGNNVQKSTLDLSNSEHIPWGDVLLRTSFQTSTVSNDTPNISESLSPKTSDTLGTSSTSPPHPPKTSPVSTPSPPVKTSPLKEEQQKRKSDAAFNRLLHSSSKQLKNSSRKSVERKASIRKRKTKASNTRRFFVHSLKEKKITTPIAKRERVCYKGVKRAHITFFNQLPPGPNFDDLPEHQRPNFTCSYCNFVSFRVNNLIEHLKYCANRQPPIDFNALHDMDKRQRIRGEDPESLREFICSSLKEIRAINRGECSGMSHHFSQDSEDDMDLDFIGDRRKFDYDVDDVVWAKVDNRYWPSLVRKIKDGKAFVRLINYPDGNKGLKIIAERAHSFNDAKWNTMMLSEAKNFPHNEIFVKSVQTAENFFRKKWLGLSVKGKDFFSMPDEDFTSEKDDYESEVVDSDEEGLNASDIKRRAHYKHLDLQKILQYLLEGHVDNYIMDIYHRQQESKKHLRYFSVGRNDPSLTGTKWFGPFEDEAEGILVYHFTKLFEERVKTSFYYISYIMEVSIPEAIVKAISDVQQMPLHEAETLCGTNDILDPTLLEPSIEEIEQMYS